MPSTDQLIADTILGKTTPEESARKIGVQLAVQRKMFCECGAVLDQHSAELWHRNGRAVGIVCLNCGQKLRKRLATIPDYAGSDYQVDTWDRTFPA
jgi:hypothetical protein